MENCKNQIVVKNLRIVAQWWTSSEGRLLRLYFGVFQPSVVSSNILNAVAQRPYEHSPWQCLRGCQGFHVTWIMVMNIHISITGSSTSTCDRRAVEQPVCEDDKIYVPHQLCWVNGRQALCASRWLMTGLHCGTIVHIIGDEQRTYLVVKGTDRNRALRLSRANGWHGDSEILMLCNSRISVLIRIKEELHSTRLYYVQACRVLGSNLPILFGFQAYLIFVIFLHGQNFWRIKFTPKKRVNYDKIHSKLPIFCVLTAKYTENCQFFVLNL